MEAGALTGAAFEQALSNGGLKHEPGVELVGMAKASERDGYVCFTTGSCDSWVDVRTEMIENAEVIGQSACKDHSHPLVKLTLAEPTTPEGKLFASLMTPSIPIPPPLDASAVMAPTLPLPPPSGAPSAMSFAAGPFGAGQVGGGGTFDPGGNCRPSFCPRRTLVVWGDGSLRWVWVWESCIDCSPILT